jgi:hypothetical protein
MIGILEKIILFFKKPKVIVIAEDSQFYVRDMISEALSDYFKIKKIKEKVSFIDIIFNKIILINSDLEKIKSYNFLLRNSQQSIFIFAGLGRDNYDCKIDNLPPFDFLIFNADALNVSDFNEKNFPEICSFGFSNKADFQITDVKINNDTNFKINYEGNIIPFWLKGKAENRKIYSALVIASLSKIFNLNLIRVSEKMKGF